MGDGSGRGETVVVFGDYDESYPRERLFLRGLKGQGLDVRECRYRPERTLVGWRKLLYLLPAYVVLLGQFRRLVRDDPDIRYVLAMRNNHYLLPLAKLLAAWQGTTLVFDAFDSNYHSAKLKDRGRLRAGLLWLVEFVGLRIPDLLIATTPGFARLYVETYRIPMNRFAIVPPGADEERFHPPEDEPDDADGAESDGEPFRVTYWGNFHRHHGVETIVEAAGRLDADELRVELIGDGLARPSLEKRAREDGIDAVEFPGRVSDEELQRRLVAADVCLGIFSDHPLARCSITNKVCEALAMGKPVITRHLPPGVDLRDDEHLVTVPPESPADLARAIDDLYADEDRRERIAASGHEYFEERLSERAIGELLAALPDE